MEIYAPIAHRLGMSRIKWELEDLCLRILDPIGYQEIVDGLEQQSERYEDFLDHIKKGISAKLDEAGIKHSISARVKHIYSIYRKMYSQHKTMNEIYDICAVRVIVDTVADCYNVLGYVHDLYKPIPGRFKDYISTPKPNGYQSLHTTVIGRDGIPFEIQIRTEEMHKMAEYGVAAHWKYKQGLDKVGNEEAFSWIRQLLEAQQDTEAEDFIKAIKVDLFADEVFVFTPKGDVVNMPAGATPIDLAYAIHSAVGNRMTGAKVNGRIAPIDSQLKNGDIVEILTSKEAHGPSRDWLKIVKTTEARNKIKQWFKKECREENIVKGKEDLDRELRANLLYNGFYENEEVIQNTLNKFSYQNIDEMYAALGYGGITLTKVLNKVKDEVGRVRRAAERTEKAEQLIAQQPHQPPKKAKHSESGVIVEGIDNCLIKFARCCTPIRAMTSLDLSRAAMAYQSTAATVSTCASTRRTRTAAVGSTAGGTRTCSSATTSFRRHCRFPPAAARASWPISPSCWRRPRSTCATSMRVTWRTASASSTRSSTSPACASSSIS